MAASSSQVLAARISYLIDDLLCDPRLRQSQRTELARVRARFMQVAETPSREPERRSRQARTRRWGG